MIVRVIGVIWNLVLLAIFLAIVFPVVGRHGFRSNAEYCNQNLDYLYVAKKSLSMADHTDAEIDQMNNQLAPGDLAPYLTDGERDYNCPHTGIYLIRPLVDSYGEVVPPVCDLETLDVDGDGRDNRTEGWHIHRLSHLQDPLTGDWFRDPAFRFPEG